jgi:hypothetical protein
VARQFRFAGLFIGSIALIVLVASVASLFLGRDSSFGLSSALLAAAVLVLSAGGYLLGHFVERELTAWHAGNRDDEGRRN